MWQIQVDNIHAKLEAYAVKGKRAFASSSFQTHSIPMLHILSTYDASFPVFFLDTGFHFADTKRFRDEITKMLGLNLTILRSPVSKASQRNERGAFLYTSDPDQCCYFNKVLPLEPILKSHDVWVSGIRRDQTKFRKDLHVEEDGAFGTQRYHPMLDWSSKMIWEYRKEYDLPEHPLESQGYFTIGCAPCTRKFDSESVGRNGRWSGMTKEECGIHTEFTGTQ